MILFIIVRTVKCLEAVLLFSGYNGPPQRRLLWTKEPDTHSSFVSSAVRRHEIDWVLNSLHLRDNTKIVNDGYYKVRSIFKNINQGIMLKNICDINFLILFLFRRYMVPKWSAEVQCEWDYDTILRKPYFQTVYSWKANSLWLQGTSLQYFRYNIYSW